MGKRAYSEVLMTYRRHAIYWALILVAIAIQGVPGFAQWRRGGGTAAPPVPAPVDAAPVPDPTLEGMPLEALFRLAVETSDFTRGLSDYQRYAQIRQAMLARAPQALPFLQQKLAVSTEWKETLTASALRGWLLHPELYASLASWLPEARIHGYANPFPFLSNAKYKKFSNVSPDAIPLMIELLWKRGQEGDSQGLSSVLAERKVEAALPVLVHEASAATIASFGSKATPFVVDSLQHPRSGRSTQEQVTALGLIGDALAVETLQNLAGGLLHKPELDYAVAVPVVALVTAKDSAWLHAEYDGLQNPQIRIKVLEALSRDKSPQNRAFLKSIATRSAALPDSDLFWQERFEAVKALLQDATADDINDACNIVLHEPNDYARGDMLIYLRRAATPRLRETLFQLLDDRPVLGRVIEALGEYQDREVTTQLLAFTKDKDPRIRSAATYQLIGRRDADVVVAAITLLQDKDELVLRHSMDILILGPRLEALKPLVALLAHPKSYIRRQSAMALRALGGQEAALALQKALKVETDESLRKDLSDFLKGIKDTVQVESLPAKSAIPFPLGNFE